MNYLAEYIEDNNWNIWIHYFSNLFLLYI
jgi:hypothetical protein